VSSAFEVEFNECSFKHLCVIIITMILEVEARTKAMIKPYNFIVLVYTAEGSKA
jgi:hypothetical protein